MICVAKRALLSALCRIDVLIHALMQTLMPAGATVAQRLIDAIRGKMKP